MIPNSTVYRQHKDISLEWKDALRISGLLNPNVGFCLRSNIQADLLLNTMRYLGIQDNDKEGIEDPKCSLKMLIFQNNCQFGSKFWIRPDEADALLVNTHPKSSPGKRMEP